MVEAQGQVGQILETTFTVENSGETGEQVLELVRLDTGEVVDSQTLELPSGQSSQEVLKWDTSGVANDTRYTVRVSSADDQVSFDVEIGSDIPDSDLFLVAGQSNAVGLGDDAASPDPAEDEVFEYINDTDSVENPLSDPIEGNNDVSDTGSAWPKFAVDYFASQSKPTSIVGAARGGTGQTTDADTADNGDWSQSGSLQDDAVSYYQNADSALGTVTRQGVLWSQGERDAQAIDDGLITKSGYKSALETMISDFRSDLNDPTLPFWVFQTGQPDSGDTAGWQAVREAQAEVVVSDPNTYMASAIQKQFPAEGKMQDDVHYTQEGYNDMGAEGAATIADRLSETLREDWEGGSSALDDWTQYDDSGNVVSDNGWAVSANETLEGTYTLDTNGATATSHVVSEGLFTTDESQTIRAYGQTQARLQIDFFWQDYGNYYMLNINTSDNEITAFQKDGGSFSSTTLDTGVVSSGTPYWIEITPTGSGSFDFEVIDMTEWTVVGNYSHTYSTTYSSGNVGFRQASGPTYHDYLRTL